MIEQSTFQEQDFHQGLLRHYFDEESEFLWLLEPLLRALGWQGAYKHLIEALPHYAKTFDITSFRNVLAKLNYKSYEVVIDKQDIIPQVLPALFVPDEGSSCLILSSGGQHQVVFDPTEKEYKVQMSAKCPGRLYVFEPMNAHSSDTGENWFRRNFSRFRFIFGQILFVSFLINMFMLVTPLFTMVVFDKVFASDSISMLGQLAIGVFVVVFGIWLLSHLRIKLLSYIGARLDITVGDALLERLLFLSPSFTENASVGAQVARIKDFDTIREFFSSPSLSVLFELPFALLFLAVIGILGGWVIVVPMTMFVVFGVLFYWLNPKIIKACKKSARMSSKKQSFMLEALANMRSIRLMGLRELWLKRFKELSSQALVSQFYSAQLTQTLNIVSETIMMISGLLVVGFCVVGVIEGHLSVGALIALMMLVWRVLAPFKVFFSMLPRLNQIITSIGQINQLMRLSVEREPHKWVQPMTHRYQSIIFSQVSFRYHNDAPPSLLGVNFKINPGELVAICGQNGSGKSTLLKLIIHLYPIQHGQILLDESNIRQMDVIELRQTLGYFPQTTCLFFGTIAQNLRFANPLATDEDLVAATQQAGVYEDIMKVPMGFDAKLQDYASQNWSVSFTQRLALARTYLKKPSILLLDEPTNGLDETMIVQLKQTLNELRTHTTVLLVTHKPSFVKMADRVLYLEQGRLLFNGSPDEVLSKIPDGLL